MIELSETQTQTLTDFSQIQKLQVPHLKLPNLKVNGVASISTQVLGNGILVKINAKTFRLKFPPAIWARFPKSHKKILAQNITYAFTFQLPYLYTTLRKLFFNMPVPLSEPYFFKALALALPSTAIMQPLKEQRVTSNLLRRLFDIDFVFSGSKSEIPPYNRISMSDRAIMPFTFGKDSLLTYALAQELGLVVYPIYIGEPHAPFDEFIKKQLSEPFKREFHKQINFLKNTLGILRDPTGWYGWELQLTQYSLMLLPYVYARRAGYILFSNEQSCDDTVMDEDGFRYNPVFEQSHNWLLQDSLMTSMIGGNSLSIGSLLEPIHEIAIMKILHHRYPQYAKYQSSCDMADKPKGDSRWCENCSKCGRMYMYLLAHGISPRTVGFKHDLLKQKYHHIYTIFSSPRIREFGYDQSTAGKNEQLLAFLMAYRKGYRGPVMCSFVKKYLAGTRKKERSLRQTFFGLHSTRTIPSDLRAKVIRIYRQELDGLK